MVDVYFSPYFDTSYQEACGLYGSDKIFQLVGDFIEWKTTGNNPGRLTDKPSALDDHGRTYRPYSVNQFHHVSLRLKRNGDPVLAFRVLPNGDILMVCITSKHEMFGRNMRKAFVKKFPDEFPH